MYKIENLKEKKKNPNKTLVRSAFAPNFHVTVPPNISHFIKNMIYTEKCSLYVLNRIILLVSPVLLSYQILPTFHLSETS